MLLSYPIPYEGLGVELFGGVCVGGELCGKPVCLTLGRYPVYLLVEKMPYGINIMLFTVIYTSVRLFVTHQTALYEGLPTNLLSCFL